MNISEPICEQKSITESVIFNRNRGMAIPIVLFVVMIGSIVMFSLAFQVESSTSDSRRTYDKKRAEYLAESAINLLFLKISEMKLDMEKIAEDSDLLRRFTEELNNEDRKYAKSGFYKVEEFDIIQHTGMKLVIKVRATGEVNRVKKSISKILKIRMQ